MRQLLVESLLLAVNGAAPRRCGGLLGPAGYAQALAPQFGSGREPHGRARQSQPVLLFSAGLAMASALICGLSPALSFSRPRPMVTVRTTAGVESRRAHHLLLAAQIALTVLLLAGTGTAVRVLIGLYRASLGYYSAQCDRPLSINLPENSYTKWADRAAFYERLRNRIADVPQVELVALATYATPPRSGERSVVEVPGRDKTGDEAPVAELDRVPEDFALTMKIPLIRGRVWSDSESAGAPHVAVVNQTMARELWPDESAIGRRVLIPGETLNHPPISGWRRPAATAGSR